MEATKNDGGRVLRPAPAQGKMTHGCDLVTKQRCLRLWEEGEGARHLSYVFTPWAPVSPGAPSRGPWCHHAQVGAHPSCWNENLTGPLVSPGCVRRSGRSRTGLGTILRVSDRNREKTQELGLAAVAPAARPLLLTLAVPSAAQSPPSPRTPFLTLSSPPPNPLPTVKAPSRPPSLLIFLCFFSITWIHVLPVCVCAPCTNLMMPTEGRGGCRRGAGN